MADDRVSIHAIVLVEILKILNYVKVDTPEKKMDILGIHCRIDSLSAAPKAIERSLDWTIASPVLIKVLQIYL